MCGCELTYYTDGLAKYWKKLQKRLTAWDIAALKLSCLSFGLYLASWFPRFTKKLRPLLALASIVLLIPLGIKMVRVFMDVFKIRAKFR